MSIMPLRGAFAAMKQSPVTRGDCFALATLGSQRHSSEDQRAAGMLLTALTASNGTVPNPRGIMYPTIHRIPKD
jgi:hypothetical protein